MKLLRGTSIIEILIATTMISVAVIAALSLMNRSQSQNIYARDLSEATRYNTQAADWIRTQRDTLGFATIYAYAEDATDYCLNSFPSDFTYIVAESCGTEYITGTVYQRKITMSKPDVNTLKFIIIVSWQEKTTRQATIEMELNKW